jgi:hypothetical protein
MGGLREDHEGSGRRPGVPAGVRSRLREAAGAHQPDRERMLARVERGMAGPPRSRRAPGGPAPWARVVAVTAGLAGVFAIAGLAVGLTVTADGIGPGQVVASGPAAPPDVPAPTARETHRQAPPPSPAGSGAGRPAPPSGRGGGAASGSPSPGSASPGTGYGNHPRDAYLWSDGSVDPGGNSFWAQSDVTVRNDQSLSALTVELRIARTAGVASTGAWSTLPTQDYTVRVEERDGALVYRWTLKDGRSVPAGTHVFAGQYNHAEGGRDAGGDRYSARGEGPGGAAEVRGDFR